MIEKGLAGNRFWHHRFHRDGHFVGIMGMGIDWLSMGLMFTVTYLIRGAVNVIAR